MSDFATPAWTTSTAEAVAVTRRHVVVVVLLAVLPLPLLSLGAIVVPLPALLQRAAAEFASLATSALDEDLGLRQEPVALEHVRILSGPIDDEPVTSASEPVAPPQSRHSGVVPGARVGRPAATAPADRGRGSGGTSYAPVDPSADDTPGTAGGGSTEGGGTPDAPTAPTAGEPDHTPTEPTAPPSPPTSDSPASPPSGQPDEPGGSSGGGPGDRGASGDPPGAGETAPGSGGAAGAGGSGSGSGGAAGAGGSGSPGDPGSGAASPPEPPSPGGGGTPPSTGGGRP